MCLSVHTVGVSQEGYKGVYTVDVSQEGYTGVYTVGVSQEGYKGVYLYPYTYSECAGDPSAVERVTSKLD